MIAAFAELTTLALRVGADSDDVTALHGRFFDGNVDVKKAWRCVLLLAEIYVPGPRATRHGRHRPARTDTVRA